MEDIRKRDIENVDTSSEATKGDSNEISKIHLADEANQFSADEDPKKLKEMMEDDQYIAELEKQARELEVKVVFLRSRLEAREYEKLLLQFELEALKARLDILRENERLNADDLNGGGKIKKN